ncbi:MAG: hypothetical protein COA74_03205 [Gammaproteobacteria bacterium]|nr:MAG: hypothetical protein COA74_03205 [Gammaproteobacteria bacterium]
MILVKGTIGLGIRERHPGSDLSIYSQESTRQWLEQLPTANLGETSRRVYHRLLESNAVLIDAKSRSSILSSLESSVKHICDSLKKHYIGHSVSLSTKQKKIANLCQAIQLEMAIGYKTIIEDLLSDEKYSNKLLPLAVNHSLYYLHSVQIRSYQLYRDLPQGLWHEIHTLYQLAEQNQFHENKYTIGTISYQTLGTYKKILLLATTNPNQLRQKDIEDIAHSLSLIARKTRLDSAPDADYDFVVNLNTDAAPFHRALIKDGMKAHYRGISLHQVVSLLQDELKLADSSKTKTGIDERILRHLLRAWGTMATRAFSRTAGNGVIKISIGLAGCHYLINKEMHGDEDTIDSLEGGALLESLEGSLKDAMVIGEEESNNLHIPKPRNNNWNSNISGPAIKTDNFWDAVYIKRSATDLPEVKKPVDFMVPTSKPTESDKYDLKEATIINVSPGGYCLKLDGHLPKQTQTGEIIGLLEHNRDGSHIWNIGTIRWMQQNDTGFLQLGVQLIAPNAEPVLGQMRSNHMDEHSYQRCLLLPELLGIGQPQTILTSPIPFSANHNLHIKSNAHDDVIHLVKLLASGHSYQQFEYRTLEVDTQVEQKASNSIDFDSLWDAL